MHKLCKEQLDVQIQIQEGEFESLNKEFKECLVRAFDLNFDFVKKIRSSKTFDLDFGDKRRQLQDILLVDSSIDWNSPPTFDVYLDVILRINYTDPS